jgi:hypothetical protein
MNFEFRIVQSLPVPFRIIASKTIGIGIGGPGGNRKQPPMNKDAKFGNDCQVGSYFCAINRDTCKRINKISDKRFIFGREGYYFLKKNSAVL